MASGKEMKKLISRFWVGDIDEAQFERARQRLNKKIIQHASKQGVVPSPQKKKGMIVQPSYLMVCGNKESY
jgi:hypothetical protein